MTLLSFLWSYLRHYFHWMAVAAVATAVFAVTSAGVLAVLPPLFEEVLHMEAPSPLQLAAPGLASSTQGMSATEEATSTVGSSNPETGSGEPSMLSMAAVEDVRERARLRLQTLYGDLQDFLGVNENNAFLKPALVAPILFVLLFATRSIAVFISGFSLQRIGFGVTTDIRNALYDRILEQSIRFHSDHPSGELFSRVVNDVSKLQNAVSTRLLDLAQQSIMLAICLVGLFLIHARLALVCLVVLPLLLVPILRFGRGIFKTSHRSQERMADLSSLLAEGIRGNRVVKAFGMEKFESDRFRAATARHLRVNLRAQALANASSPVVETLAATGAAVLIVFASGMIRRGELTPALFMTFLTVLYALYDPVRKLNKVNLVLQEAMAAVQRISSILAIPNDIVDEPTQPAMREIREGLCFEQVRFAYGPKRVLSDFQLDVKAGEVVALVGPSGAGKSTVVHLLPRFFDPDEGSVQIDGIDIRSLPLANLRSLIGIVTQDTVLFNDSVRNNIAYGRNDLSVERVREAAAAAYADEFIMELENGYDTVIGESGHQLSGGQRQRLAIARALLKNAPILILDEATSHLDTQSEVLVQRAIYNLMEGRTALVIAHRISTITRADRILVMEGGSIVEEGTHEQLLARDGSYKELYDLQFRNS